MGKNNEDRKASGTTGMTDDILDMISDTEIIMDVEVERTDGIQKTKRMTSVDLDKNITE